MASAVKDIAFWISFCKHILLTPGLICLKAVSTVFVTNSYGKSSDSLIFFVKNHELKKTNLK